MPVWWFGMRPNSQLKVLYVIDSLGAGGAERSLAEILPYLSADHIETIIACLMRRDEGVHEAIVNDGFDVRFIEAKRLSGRVLELRRLIRLERPDLVHSTLFESDIAARLAAVRSGVPVVTSLVNTSYDPVRFQDPNIRPWRLRALRAVDSWTARHLTTHFHALTSAVSGAAVRSLGIPLGRITVIERGRDGARLGHPSPGRRRRARLALGLAEDDEVLVNAGRHEFQKGQRYLLEAMARLVPHRSKALLLIAGRRGNVSEEIEALTKERRLGDRVRLLGHRDDLPEILAAADLFVFPSLYEGLGGSVIEAMALGVPIVASDLEALREVVEPERNAVLVPPASPLELASAIEALLDDPGRRFRFGQRSRAIFEERFTIERCARRMAALYRRVVAHRAGAGVMADS